MDFQNCRATTQPGAQDVVLGCLIFPKRREHRHAHVECQEARSSAHYKVPARIPANLSLAIVWKNSKSLMSCLSLIFEPLLNRKQITSEDLRQETLALNMSCHGVKVEEQRAIVGPKPWPRLLRLSTYISAFHDVMDCFSVGCCFMCVWCAFFLGIIGTFILCLYVSIGYGEPYTELQGVTLRNFNLSRSNSSWELASDLVVVFEAGNPSKIAGFKTRFLHTEVDASFHNATLGSSSIPPFSQGRKSRRDLTTEVQIHNRQLDEGSALALQAEMQRNDNILGLRINVNAHTKQKYLARTLDRWFNLTCVVDMTVPSASEPGHLLSKSCTLTSTEPNYIGTLCAIIICIPI
jgi:hypothetical protein